MKRRIPPIHRVALLDAGERLRVKLPLLVRKLNSLQHSFLFEAADSMTLETLGEPDVEYEFYSVQSFYTKLKARRDYRKFDYMIAITDLKITDPQEVQLRDKRYFSTGDKHKLAVVSANRSVLEFASPLKDEYQYVAYLVMCELLLNIVGTHDELLHAAPRRCLFDECNDLTSLKECIEDGSICPHCFVKLKDNNISDRILEDVNTVLIWCKKNRIIISLRHTASDPWFILIVGAAVALPATWYIPQSRYKLLVAIVFVAIAAVFMRKHFARTP
jgi:hypothetical protein